MVMDVIVSKKGEVLEKEFFGVDKPPVYFTDNELKDFFSSISLSKSNKKHRDFVFFMTLLCTGKRVSEVLMLKRNDIDFDKKIIRFNSLKKRKKRVMYLRLHKDLSVPMAIFIGGMSANQPIFNFTRQHADYLVKKYGRKSNIVGKRVSCHIFRHTFAVIWLLNDGDIFKLSKWLDHSSITQTVIYLRIINKSLYNIVDYIDFGGVINPNIESKNL